MTLPTPATIKSVTFLQAWCNATGTYPTLTAIPCDPVTGVKGKTTETKAFASLDWRAVHAWIDARQGKCNLYFLVNATINPLDKKSGRANIGRMVALHIDVDVRVGEDQVEGIARIVKSFEAYTVPPTFVTSSGGGAQAFWVLDPPLAIDGDEEKYQDAKLYNMQVERDLDGDHCHNVDRIMRIPGTINIPDEVKIKKRRVAALAMTLIVEPERKYPLGTFKKAVGPKPTATDGATMAGEPKKEGSLPAPTEPDDLVFENVPLVDDDTPIISLGDQRLSGVNPLVKYIIANKAAPDDAPENIKTLTAGGLDQKVVGELVRVGLTDKAIKEVYLCGKIGADWQSWPRGWADLDRLVEKTRAAGRIPKLEWLNWIGNSPGGGGNCEVMISGKWRILSWDKSFIQGQRLPIIQDHDNFEHGYDDQFLYVTVNVKDEEGNITGTKDVKRKLVPFWFKHPLHRKYWGMAFMPYTDNLQHDRKLNLWTGYAYKDTGSHNDEERSLWSKT